MPILVNCHCGRTLRARDEQAGKRCKCPGCGTLLTVPVPAAPVIPEPVIPAVASAAPIPAEPVELDYAGTAVPKKADPLVLGAARPLPVIARPTQDVARLDKSWRGQVWWILLFMLVPLASLTLQTRPTLKERIERTIAKSPTTVPSFGAPDEGYPYLEQALDEMPSHKLDGALLARHSVFPIVFALIASGAFVLAVTHAIPAGDANRPRPVIAAGVFTGTAGVLLLLGLQASRFLCCIPLFYMAALHPGAPFGASLVGFVLGVGVCEEVIKCLPILYMLYRGTLLNWREACIIGMASGAGFGISEGIFYSFRFYNGIETADAYVVRFMSDVAFHTLLTGACAIMIQRKQEHLIEDMDPLNWLLTLMAIILMPIFLHGLFDTLAKKHLHAGALGVAVLSFFWLAWLIRRARRREQSVALALTGGPTMIRTAKGTRWIGPPTK